MASDNGTLVKRNWLQFFESLGGNLDLSQQSDLLLFDISKAFDTVLTDDCWINKISTEFMEISRHGSNNG